MSSFTQQQKNNKSKKILLTFFIFIFFFVGGSTIASVSVVPFMDFAGGKVSCGVGSTASNKDLNSIADAVTKEVGSGQEIKTVDATVGGAVKKVECVDNRNGVERKLDQLQSWALDKLWKETILAGGTVAIQKALGSALNTIAYDTATYVGSGGKGQKPAFITEGWGTYLTNVGDNTAGTFLETFGKEGAIKFNLCEPSLGVRIKIGLGLVQFAKPTTPKCTFKTMTSNWSKALQDKNFLQNFQDMFNPASNDFGVALTMQTGIISTIEKELNLKTLLRQQEQGYLPNTSSIAGYQISAPGELKRQIELVGVTGALQLTKTYTDPLAEAANIFVNQLAITLFNNLMGKIAEDKLPYTSPYSGDYGLSDYNDSSGGGGVAATEDKLKKIIEPAFNVRGDYKILNELAGCVDSNKAGPTSCVIDDKFRDAVQNKVTVGEALKKDYFNSIGVFGFMSDGLEPKYNEGYPYRSMIILRKFRIIPVGWEVAAQYIKDHYAEVGSKNIEDLINCFDPNDEYIGESSAWCRGLVDPTWVLKAPMNYCKREGFGPEITEQQISGEGDASNITVSRNDNYCADEQACIKEKSDGSCLYYGYCSEERRKWNFNADSCDANYNTCQTFRSVDGKTASYLENTLDYSICGSDNAGCKAYATSSTAYAADIDSITWSSSTPIYFNRNIVTCEAEDEGCHGFMRTRTGTNANLLMNSNFEDDNWGWIPAGSASAVTIDQTEYYSGIKSLKIENTSLTSYSSASAKIEAVVPGDIITVSYYVKSNLSNGPRNGAWLAIYAYRDNNILIKDHKTDEDYQSSSVLTSDYTGDNAWRQVEFSFIAPEGTSYINIEPRVEVTVGVAYFDSIKVEYGKTASTYSNYTQNQIIYEKLVPNYLYNDCYANASAGNYSLISGHPAICDNFVRQCNRDEVNCEMYTAKKDRMEIPAKTSAEDVCPTECSGYNTFIQGETPFDTMRDAYYVPTTAKTCSAEVVGCDEFTNLDDLSKGGEAKNYYSYLRQCVTTTDSACVEFYTWEGSSEAGYQLKNFVLKGTKVNGIMQPATTEDTSSICSEVIYNLPASDPAFNPDCRQFYEVAGQVSYKSYSRTISCNDNCHPYRRTENNLDPKVITAGECVGAEKYWDVAAQTCTVCINGGIWNTQQRACVYMAIPEEGVMCQAIDNGCREYGGNTGNNIQVILNSDFENSSSTDWSGGTIDAEALLVGDHSLRVSGSKIETIVGSTVSQGSSYVLSFVAKSNGAKAITKISITNGISSSDFSIFKSPLTDGWQRYEFNLSRLDHTATSSEKLTIESDEFGFYIDNIKLQKIVDRYYLIKNSWKTPDSCDQDIYGSPSPGYMLGCAEYTDRDNNVFYFHSFSQLCQESAVGCEAMFDTQNSTDYKAIVSTSGVVTPADQTIYVVYNKEKECNVASKGCQRTSKINTYGQENMFAVDSYLINNPDKYSSIMCLEEAVGCDEYSTTEGNSYFKDPGDQVCEWRQATGIGLAGWGWFKKKISKCDVNKSGKIEIAEKDNSCLSAKDCAKDIACVADDNDYSCDTSYFKTIGLGGSGNKISQPVKDNSGYNWAGSCSATDAGCTEYIDPISSFNNSLMFNSDLKQDVDGNVIPDGWDQIDANTVKQEISLDAFTLYRLARVSSAGDVSLSCDEGSLRELNSDNIFSVSINELNLLATSTKTSILFYSYSSAIQNCTITVSKTGSAFESAELKKVVVDYQLLKNIDKTTCNGAVDPDNGCILFNERKQNGSVLVRTIWDADAENKENTKAPVSGISSVNDSNQIIKVVADRVCDKWLACKSYIKNQTGDNVCVDIGLCDALDNNGSCGNIVPSNYSNANRYNLAYGANNVSAQSISNYTGYVKVGLPAPEGSISNGQYPLSKMSQVGEVTSVSNGSFEYFDNNNYPIGWNPNDGQTWDESHFGVISSPYRASIEGIKYSQDGYAFLKYAPASGEMFSEFIDVEPNSEYILSGNINTLAFKSGAGFDNAKITIKVLTFDSSGTETTGSNTNNITLDNGFDWQKLTKKFSIGSGLYRIKLKIMGELSEAGVNKICSDVTLAKDSCAGYAFIDKIDVGPALQSSVDKTTSPTCRLYPESSSMNCGYYNESGTYMKGWPGYCLEYDRSPGDSNSCILWYPIDRIKGDFNEEGAGYLGKVPVFYCTEAKTLIPLEYRWTSGIFDSTGEDDNSGNGACPPGYDRLGFSTGDPGCGYSKCAPSSSETCYYDCKSGSGWYVSNGFHNNPLADGEYSCLGGAHDWPPTNESKYGVKYYNPNTGEIFDDIFAYCTKVVQTVGSAGSNKYWSGRTYKGSDYIVSGLGYTYLTDASPFGSITEPSPSGNPFTWDGSSKDGFQPLYVKNEDARASHPYKFDTSTVGGSLGFLGVCKNTDEICYSVPGVAYENNKADCQSGNTNDVCVATDFVNQNPVEKIQRFFAQSYGSWGWSPTTFHYEKTQENFWGPPSSLCNNTGTGQRPAYPNDYCAILPRVTNIKINSFATDVELNKNSFANLVFNSEVDSQQSPMISYKVNWGDGDTMTVTGVEMFSRPNENNPHSLYHIYNYWDLLAKKTSGTSVNSAYNEINCGVNCKNDGYCDTYTGAYCRIQPKIQIKDNWGWCNNGQIINTCLQNQWDKFGGWVVVKEK